MDFFKKAQESLGSGKEADLLKQAEGFMGSQSSDDKTAAAPAADAEKPAATGGAAAPAAPAPDSSGDYKEVYGSAQTLFQGLQDKLGGKESNIDNQELAGAASNVLEAAEKSGFAKDSEYGQYFDKAEGYLQNYARPGETAAAPDAAPAPAAAPAAEKAPAAAPPAQ